MAAVRAAIVAAAVMRVRVPCVGQRFVCFGVMSDAVVSVLPVVGSVIFVCSCCSRQTPVCLSNV